MGQIIVRNLDDAVIQLLKTRARLANKSLEQTVRDILCEAAKPSREEAWAEIDRLREEMRKRNGGDVNFDFTAAIREDRDNDEPHR